MKKVLNLTILATVLMLMLMVTPVPTWAQEEVDIPVSVLS